MNSNLSSLIHFLSTAGFSSESSELIKLSGGAIPIPQKMYDVCAEHMRNVTALGLKRMFEDIPEKLAKIESSLRRIDQFYKLAIKDLNDFCDMSDDERSAHQGILIPSDDGKYILIAGLYLSLPYFDPDGSKAGWGFSPCDPLNLDIIYDKDSKSYSVLSGEKDYSYQLDKAFQYGEKEKNCYHVIGWFESQVSNWHEVIDSAVDDIRNGIANLDQINVTGNPRLIIDITDDKGNKITDKTSVDAPRRFTGRAPIELNFGTNLSPGDIPVDMTDYKYYKEGIKYPDDAAFVVKFFDPEKDKPQEGKDDLRWGYFRASEMPAISVGVPLRDFSIESMSGNYSIDSLLENSLVTLGHELTHFGQHIISLNSGVKKTDLMTGKFPTNKEKKQYDTHGRLKLKPRQRLSPSGKMEWSLHSPANNQYFWFGDTKPTDEIIRDIVGKNVEGGGIRLEHELRDVEQKTRLYNELAEFKRLIKDADPKIHNAAFKKYVGYNENMSAGGKDKETISSVLWNGRRVINPSHWLAHLKTNEPEKWKQVVLAMYQELSKDPDVLLSGPSYNDAKPAPSGRFLAKKKTI